MSETTNRTPVPAPDEPAVLIAGAGPTGLTLAVELARSGVSFRLIEAAPGPQPGSRGKGIQPRTLEVFGDLGLVDRELAHGRLAMPMVRIAPDGQLTGGGGEPEELKNRPDIPYTTSLITPEWRTEEALRLRLADLGGSGEFGTTLDPLPPTHQGGVGGTGKGGGGEGGGVGGTGQGRRDRDGHRPLAGRLRRRPQHRPQAGRHRFRRRDPRGSADARRRRRGRRPRSRRMAAVAAPGRPVRPLPAALDRRLPVPGQPRAGAGPRPQPGQPAGHPGAADRPDQPPPPRAAVA